MIGFQLTDEQEQMRQLARRFAQQEIRPVAAEYDRKDKTPQSVLRKAAQIGLMSCQYPVEKWIRDAKILQIVEGTSQIQKVVISQMLAMGME